MSYFQKGQTALQKQVNQLQEYVYSIQDPPAFVNQYNKCEGKECLAPEGFPGTVSPLNVLPGVIGGTPANILVNFEWTNEEEETFNWCCCYTFNKSTSVQTRDVARNVISIVWDEDCTGTPCEDCHEVPPCVITTPAPGGTLSFITGGVGSGTVDCTTIDAYNDGWNGMSMSIVHATTGVVAATYTGPPPGASPQTETPLTLDNDTEYGIYINTKGDYPQENTIDIQQDGGTLLNHTFPTAEGGISDCSWAEAPGGEVLGCTDPTALNYDPAATVDDGSCIYEPEP